MHRAIAAALVSLFLASCLSSPKSGLPDGTYVDAGGSPDTLIIDGSRISMYLPAMHSTRRVSPEGRDFTFALLPEGRLRVWGSSNDTYFLQLVSDCDWRWNSPAIECRRKDGPAVRFVREHGSATAPPMPRQRVWLAAATHVRDNESQGVTGDKSLPVYHRTAFPRFRFALAQLEKQAQQGFCGLSREEAAGVVRSLHWQNKTDRAIGDLFDHRPGFALKESRREKGDQIGLSDVVFDRAGTSAYLNVDIGGRSGSIVRVELRDGAWQWAGECAQWISWR